MMARRVWNGQMCVLLKGTTFPVEPVESRRANQQRGNRQHSTDQLMQRGGQTFDCRGGRVIGNAGQ